MESRTCPTCRAPIPADIGWGLQACPYCNTAMDMGPPPEQDRGEFHAGPSAFIPSQANKAFGAPSGPLGDGSGQVPPPPVVPHTGPSLARQNQPFAPRQSPYQMQFMAPPVQVYASPPQSSGSGLSLVVIIILVSVGISVLAGLLPLIFLFF